VACAEVFHRNAVGVDRFAISECKRPVLVAVKLGICVFAYVKLCRSMLEHNIEGGYMVIVCMRDEYVCKVS